MNQLFYNTAGGIVHQLRSEQRTTTSEVIVRGKWVKHKENWFYFNFSIASSSFKLINFKTEKFTPIRLPLKVETDQVVFCLVLPECLSVKIAFYPPTVKRIVTALIPSFLFHCFSLFLPHLRTLAQEKRSEICLRFGTSGPSLCLYPLLSRNIIYFLALTMAARAKNNFWRSELLTLSARTIGILSRLTYMYTEFDCVALLAML